MKHCDKCGIKYMSSYTFCVVCKSKLVITETQNWGYAMIEKKEIEK